MSRVPQGCVYHGWTAGREGGKGWTALSSMYERPGRRILSISPIDRVVIWIHAARRPHLLSTPLRRNVCSCSVVCPATTNHRSNIGYANRRETRRIKWDRGIEIEVDACLCLLGSCNRIAGKTLKSVAIISAEMLG